MQIYSLKRVLLLVVQLDFPKNVPHFREILRPVAPLKRCPPALRGQQGVSLRRYCERGPKMSKFTYDEVFQFSSI